VPLLDALHKAVNPVPVQLRLFRTGDYRFYPAFEGTAVEEDPALAFKALNADIGTEPDNQPLIAAAGVLFLEADHVTEL